MAPEDEFHLANQIAFLASYKEGVHYVSAATVQERTTPPALLIRLASNKTPNDFVVQKLRGIFKVIRAYASRTIRRDECETQLFDEVLALSSSRIHGRLRSSRSPKPVGRPYVRSKDAPLHQRLSGLLKQLVTQTENSQGELTDLRQELKELCSCYQAIDDQISVPGGQLLKQAVRKSYEVSISHGDSLETSLKRLGLDETLYENRIVLQIDKVGRYLGICKFLTRLCRKQNLRPIFRDIELLETKPSPGAFQRSGKKRFVHAEIQIILSLEKDQVLRFPRAIGASKSACFLCNLFIHHHGAFRVAHAHNVLYDQWTLPDVNWMGASQLTRYQGILNEMTKEILGILTKTTEKKQHHPLSLMSSWNGHVSQNIQSRAHLLIQPIAPETPTEVSSTPEMIEDEDDKTAPQVPSVISTASLNKGLASATKSNSTTLSSIAKLREIALKHSITSAIPGVLEDGEDKTIPQTPNDNTDTENLEELLLEHSIASQIPEIVEDGDKNTRPELPSIISAATIKKGLTYARSNDSADLASTNKLEEVLLEHSMTLASTSLRFSTDKIELFFEFSDIRQGHLSITKNESDPRQGQSIDICSLPIGRDVSFKLRDGQDELGLRIYDGSQNLLHLLLSWTQKKDF